MMEPVVISGWPAGMDNIHADHELDAKTLRRAVNADVLDSGKLARLADAASATEDWPGLQDEAQ
jgi:hypothetical protein